MRIDNYRYTHKNGKRVKEHSYMTFPKFKSIASKGYKRKGMRSNGYSDEGGGFEIAFGFISIVGSGLLSFYITFGLFMEFFIDINGVFGGLLALLFIGFLLHFLLLVLVIWAGNSIVRSISGTGQPVEKQHVEKNKPDYFEHVKLSNETKIRLEIEWAEWQKKRGLLK